MEGCHDGSDELSSQERQQGINRIVQENEGYIGCKWVFAMKQGYLDSGTIRYKGGLVAKGYTQREGIVYIKVFSPVVKHLSIRILLALVEQYELKLDQLDVKTAFLYGDLDEEIFISSTYEVQDCKKRELGVQVEEIAL